jgi:hypothetical protein
LAFIGTITIGSVATTLLLPIIVTKVIDENLDRMIKKVQINEFLANALKFAMFYPGVLPIYFGSLVSIPFIVLLGIPYLIKNQH